MNKKTWISLMLTLLMVLSTYTVVGTAQNYIPQSKWYPPKGTIDFQKWVWRDNSYWDDYVEGVEVGTTVRFNISLTYHKNPENTNPWVLHHIVIKDTLPECLVFADNVAFYNTPAVEEEINDNVIIWNFSGCDQDLSDGQTMTIEFDATVVESQETENENIGNVTAQECGVYDHTDEDSAWVYVYVPPPPPSLLFEKEVYDPATGQWVDYLDGVQKGIPVKFRITITYLGYEGVELMKCMTVEDYLPECCLEYAGNEIFTYPSEDFQDPEITVSEDLKYVKYDWSNKMFNLFAGETITIEFDANVVQYCYAEVENCADVDLWTCCPEFHLYARDCATVNCYPPESQFEKKVQDPQTGEWVEDAFQYVNQTVTYKIELTYYGNYELTDVRVVDYLPFITYYANEANIEPTSVSEDGRTVWWNLTEPVVDGAPLVITFNAFVWGSTGDCELCGINLAQYTAIESETQIPYFGEDTAEITTNYMGDPMLAYSPNNINFGTHDQGWTGSDTFKIWNAADQTLIYTISESADWLQVTPTSGSSTGEQDTITVSVIDTEGMSGFYSANINIVSNGGSGTIFVALYINAPGQEPEPQLTITIPKKIFVGKVCAKIENTGETDVTNLNWEINLTAGIRKKAYATEGTIELLEINKMQQVCTGKLIGKSAIKLKFGRITGIVTASSGEYSTSIEFSGFVLGRLIIIRSYTTPEVPE